MMILHRLGQLVNSAAMVAFVSLLSAVTYSDVARIAYASSMSLPVKRWQSEFELGSPHRLQLVSASSGKLYAQIVQGAPFDVFLSADQEKPQQLIERGLALESSRFTYATGRLVLWSRSHDTPSKATLLAGQYHSLAIANPRLAPYGKAALELLHRLGVEGGNKDISMSGAKSKLVMGENIGHAFQYVYSGAAQIGLVALFQVEKNDYHYWLVPEHYHSAIKQDAVLLQKANTNPAAIAFMHFLKGKTEEAQR